MMELEILNIQRADYSVLSDFKKKNLKKPVLFMILKTRYRFPRDKHDFEKDYQLANFYVDRERMVDKDGEDEE